MVWTKEWTLDGSIRGAMGSLSEGHRPRLLTRRIERHWPACQFRPPNSKSDFGKTGSLCDQKKQAGMQGAIWILALMAMRGLARDSPLDNQVVMLFT